MVSRVIKYLPMGNRVILLIMVIHLASIHCREDTPDSDPFVAAWDQAEQIAANIELPRIPDRLIKITDLGALADGQTDCLPAIRRAIDSCFVQGGGTVWIPAGTYFVQGPIHLKSRINLHLAKNATLRFSTNPSHYLPVVRTRWEGVDCYNYSPLIYAYQQEDIAITGSGTLDGQADTTNWWPWSNSRQYGWRPGELSQGDTMSRPRLYDWNTREVPVEERQLGEGAYLRPNFIQPFACTRVLIDSVTIRNSPMWVIHPCLSEQVVVRHARIISHGPNSDGCDPESCRNVLIEHCYFDTGDDCIALKSGRNQDGRRANKPIENVVIRDCRMKDGHGGVVIGSEVSGGARNIYAEDCQMDSPNLDRALRIKTNRIRGGTVENLFFRDIKVGEVREAVIRVNLHYPIYSDPNQEYIPIVRNIYLEGVESSRSTYGLLIEGYDEAHPVQGIYLKDCRLNGVTQGNKIEFAEDLQFKNSLLNGAPL